MTNNQIQPIFILPEGSHRNTGRQAQKGNIAAAKMVAETVRTTLGPKGMDKMLVDASGDVVVTNDGVTILQEMSIENPSAKMIVEVAKTQEDEVGDGTTTAVVLAGEFLKQAEDLLDQDIHPTVIARGYRLAEEKAQHILNDIAEPVSIKDSSTLQKIAQTAMTGKGAESAKEILAELVVNAIKDIADEDEEGNLAVNRSNIRIEKKSGANVESSQLIRGVVIDKEPVHANMPRYVPDAKIALIDSALEIKNTEVDAKIQINDPVQMQAFLDQEEKMLKEMADTLEKAGATVVFCQKGIDELVQHFLAKKNIYAVRRVRESDMKALAKATGASLITNLHDLNTKDLGKGTVIAKKFGEEEMTIVQDCKNPKVVTLLVRGGTEHVTDEIKRAITDAVGDIASAVNGGKVVAGAGAPEIEIAKQLRVYAEGLSGREQLAVQAFANAMEIIPRTLAENAGLDPIDVLTDLKAAHDKKQKWAGVDVFTGKTVDAWKKGVIEPLKIKTQAVSSAAEVAIMILRIDDVITSEGSKNQQPPPDMGGMPGMM